MSDTHTFSARSLEHMDVREAAREALAGTDHAGARTVVCRTTSNGWVVTVHAGDDDSPGETLARWQVFKGGTSRRLSDG